MKNKSLKCTAAVLLAIGTMAASPAFAGNPFKALPAMVLSATISSSPTLIYCAQELGEAGALASGFGQPTRSTIFDYAGVPSQQRWMNGGRFDGALLSADEKKLRGYYSRLLNFTGRSTALMGKYAELQTFNRANSLNYSNQVHNIHPENLCVRDLPVLIH